MKDPALTITVTVNGSYLHRSKSVFCLKTKNSVTTTGSMSKSRTKELDVVLDKYSQYFIAGFSTARLTTGSLSIPLTKDANSFLGHIEWQNRLCVDFRVLNKITVKGRYPLPRIEDQLDELSGNKYFTSLDMTSGFHQIPIAEDSIKKQLLSHPMDIMNICVCHLVYMDDVLITSKTIDESLEKLDIVLKALVESGFSLNLDNCKFVQTTIEYLGREVWG